MFIDPMFCAPCALWRIGRGEPIDLVLEGMPPSLDALKLIGHPVCSHHRRMLHSKPIEGWVYDADDMLMVGVIGLEQRDIFDQADLLALVRGDAKTGIVGMLAMLHRLRGLHWMRQRYIAEQETTILHISQEAIDDGAANEEMFQRIHAYLNSDDTDLDTDTVMIDDRSSGEE